MNTLTPAGLDRIITKALTQEEAEAISRKILESKNLESTSETADYIAAGGAIITALLTNVVFKDFLTELAKANNSLRH